MVQNKTKWFFLEPLLTKEKPIHLSEISKKLKTSHTIVRRYLLDFEKIGLLKKEIIGRQTFYSFNPEYYLLLDYLVVAEKEKLIKHSNSSLLLKDLIFNLHKIELPALIFGSFSEENKSKSKDIDLLLVGDVTKKIKERLKSIEKKINKKIHLINVDSLEEIDETLKREILSKHLIINNSELILRWLR